jgi:hypothetical protein
MNLGIDGRWAVVCASSQGHVDGGSYPGLI